ncbi:hypothetical protein L211DRAFT_895476 [Terfezia boudieri ATCC MYA-4762]|uniref:Uncharacterized protein n=1 Tax=Terfezia boudieri ATCC MYA-4762 TaxID=1051890 RepID=A0A3N4LF08_9PEZI|nr:hypothetical protein L211DRAFT_895476 [Terfezia boudieri ATCC MYA-4762]
MAAYGMIGCNTSMRIRPQVCRAVTAPDTSPKAVETHPRTSAQRKYIPSAPSNSGVDKNCPPPQARILLNECATDYLHPRSASETTPEALQPQVENVLKAELRLLAGTAGTQPVLQSDPVPGVMVTISRGAYPTLEELYKALGTHSIFHTHADPTAATVLCINDLAPCEFHKLYNHLAPHLESFRIKIDFNDTTLIMRCPSEAHESGVDGWNSVWSLLKSQMPMPPELQSHIHWKKGQPDVNLPPLSPGGHRMKCPDACLGRVGERIPTLVLETGYSQMQEEVHNAAKTWLSRLIRDGIDSLEDHAVQCVILFKINENLTKIWLPAFRESLQKQDFNVNKDNAPHPATFLSMAALGSTALTLEIWRNERDIITGGLKREHTVLNRPTCTIPVCISEHHITTEELFDTWIWEYLSEVRERTNDIFFTLPGKPPIPRSTVSTDKQNKYFTLYLDDLTSPKDIPQDLRGEVWLNVPVKMWVWGYLLSQGVGFEGWKKEVVDGLGIAWAKWRSGNKENQEPNVGMENERRVLGDMGEDNGQPSVKRRKVEKGF